MSMWLDASPQGSEAVKFASLTALPPCALLFDRNEMGKCHEHAFGLCSVVPPGMWLEFLRRDLQQFEAS
jgi:hypothetical protein